MAPAKSKAWFSRFAEWTAHVTGKPVVFVAAAGSILVWAICGPLFQFSDTWQLVVNTSTTIITFLMVFLIQNTQNRDSQAIHVKLDELIRTSQGAHNALLDLEELEADDIGRIRANYEALAKAARTKLRNGQQDTDITPLPD